MNFEIESMLKRLAVSEVCAEHELLELNTPHELVKWYDFVVGNKIALHFDEKLPDLAFTVAEKYENVALCVALQGAYEFACTVWERAENRGKSYSIIGDAFPTSRVLEYNPDGDLFEMCAIVEDDATGEQYRACWIFRGGDTKSYEDYDYDLDVATLTPRY